MNKTLPAKDQSTRPRCEAAHSPLPWKLDDSVHAGTRWIIADGLLCVRVLAGNFNSKDKPVLSDEERDANAAYIVKACNQFPQLEAQRDKYRKALEWIANKLRAEGSADTQDAFQIIHHIEATTNG